MFEFWLSMACDFDYQMQQIYKTVNPQSKIGHKLTWKSRFRFKGIKAKSRLTHIQKSQEIGWYRTG